MNGPPAKGKPARKPQAAAPPAPSRPAGQPPERGKPPRASQPGCLGKLFLDLTGLGFLLQIRRKLGTAGFLVAFTVVLLIMFIAGARIERYGHLGEHQYVMSVLPLASCFSPILALLMALAFAIGNVLTNATFWLFPQDSFLNLYHLFGKPAPLLTWGAYARMDFISLPVYAILPGLGSRTLYTVASTLFQAGRAKIMRDGGPGNRAQLQAQLSQALKQQTECSRREEALEQQFQDAEGKAAHAGGRVAEIQAEEAEVREASGRINAETQKANEEAAQARTQTEQSSAKLREQERLADDLTGQKSRADRQLADADARLRTASGEEQDLQDKQGTLAGEKADLDGAVGETRARVEALSAQRNQLLEMGKSGLGPDGKPLSPPDLARVRQEYLKTQAAFSAENERLAQELARQKAVDAELRETQEQLREKKKEAGELLEKYREEQKQAEELAKKEELARERAAQTRKDLERQNEALKAAQERASNSQKQAQLAKEQAERLGREKAAAVQAMNQAAIQRNALAQQYKAAAQQRAAADQRVSQLQQALGAASQPPPKPSASKPDKTPVLPLGPATGQPQEAGAYHRRSTPEDVYEKFKREWDKGMYEEMERQRMEREQLMRQWQDQYKGSLPSGVAGYDVAGVGEVAAQGIGSLAAAAVGAAAGTALGGLMLHGHMWAEYFPLREMFHPSHEGDPSCFHMDSDFLDQNILSGAATGAVGGPISVITADTGAVAPPSGPGSTSAATSPGPVDAPGSFQGAGPGGTPPTFGSDDEKAAWEASQKAKQEAEDMKKQWADSEQSADKSDPNYDKVKKQYDDYIKSKEDEAAADQGKYDELKDAAAKKAADEADAKAYKEQWVKSRQDDLAAAAEEKAHLEAVKRGADDAGFDTSEHQKRLDELNQRINELHGQLGKEGADISYTAADRGTIAPGKEFTDAIAQNKELKQQAAQIDYMNKMQQAALDQNLWNPGGPGDVVGKIQDIKDKIWQGQGPDKNQVAFIQKILDDHQSGKAATEDKLPDKEILGSWFNKDLWKEAGWETAKNLSQCTSTDGSISWSGMAGRMGIGLLTGGTSEAVFIPMAGAIAAKETLDKGGGIGSAAWNATWEMGMQYIGGKVLEGGGKVLLGGAKGALEGGIEGGVSGAKKALVKEGQEAVKGVKGAIDKVKGILDGSGEGLPKGDLPAGQLHPQPGESADSAVRKLANAQKQLPNETYTVIKDGQVVHTEAGSPTEIGRPANADALEGADTIHTHPDVTLKDGRVEPGGAPSGSDFQHGLEYKQNSTSVIDGDTMHTITYDNAAIKELESKGLSRAQISEKMKTSFEVVKRQVQSKYAGQEMTQAVVKQMKLEMAEKMANVTVEVTPTLGGNSVTVNLSKILKYTSKSL